MRLTDEELRGRIVLSGDGVTVGEISRLFVDGADWRITAIQVRLRKEIAERIGVPRSIWHAVTIEIETEQIQSVGDAVILAIPVDALRSPPPAQPSASAPLH
jgi:sporulation protein YlmC with PRC-barrel domain